MSRKKCLDKPPTGRNSVYGKPNEAQSLSLQSGVWESGRGRQSQQNPGRLSWFSCFSICPWGGTLLLYLLNMYVSYWPRGSHYISEERRTVDNGGPVVSFLYLGLSASWCISQRNLFRLPHLSLPSDMKMWIPASGPGHTVTSAIWRHHGGGPPPKLRWEKGAGGK